MKQEYDEALCRKYPKLFKLRHCDPGEAPMCFGFECGDGWFPLIDRLAAKITALDEKREPTVAVQVKQKFGGLRFYIDCGYDDVQAVIDEAEKESYKTCEACGKPGEPNSTGWIMTLCPECRKPADWASSPVG